MAGVNLKSLEKGEVEEIFRGVDTILSDCDGVLWIVDKAVSGVPATVKKLKEIGKRFLYVTNNARSSRQGFLNQIQALGYAAQLEEAVCTSYLVAKYLESINFKKKVYLVGEAAIGQELDAVGIPHTGVGPDVVGPDLVSVVKNFLPDPEIGAVVIGLDEHISYPKLMRAATYLNNPDVVFVATSMDIQIPVTNKKIPGPGALVKCVETCSERKPFVVGKPEPYITRAIKENFDLKPERTLLIGDSLRTDILLGKRCGIKTLLVLTGVTTERDVKALMDSTALETRELIPDFYIDSLADLDTYL